MNCQIWDLERRGHCQVSSECLGSYLYCYKLKKNSVKNRKKKLFYVEDGLQVYAM